MKALRLHALGDVRLHDEPEPEPGAGEVVVRVTSVGLCGSDRHWLLEAGIGDAVLTRPLVLGHEFAGTIESGERAGERVAVDPAIPCGACETCAAGLEHLCPRVEFAGHSLDGALRERLAWPERLAFPVPAGIGDAEAALLEPLGVALHAVDLGKIRPGMSTAVFGCGPLGLLLAQALVAEGVEVAAADPLPHRLEAALASGATAWEPGGREVEVAFEVAGEDQALATAIDAARPGGRVVLVGIPDGDRTSFPAAAARRKGLTLLLSRRMRPGDLPRAIALAPKLDLASLVTERHSLEAWPEAFDSLVERRSLKVVIHP